MKIELNSTQLQNGGMIFEGLKDLRLKWEVERDELIEKNCTCKPCNYCTDNNPAKWKK